MKFHSLLFVVTMAMLLSGCQKEVFSFGDDVRFAVRTGKQVQTKTAYSGEKNSDDVERIDWKPGDILRIWCNESSSPAAHYADYSVNEVADVDGSHKNISEASIVPYGGSNASGLRWGDPETTHDYYAVSPSPLSGGVTQSMDGKSITGMIQKSQTYKSVTHNGSHATVIPDLDKSMMMVASTSILESEYSEETVFLEFTPLTTALEFTVTNSSGSALKLRNISLSSGDVAGTVGHPLSGPFSVSIGTKESGIYASYEKCTYTGTLSEDKSVTIGDFPESGSGSLSIDDGGSLTFTFFLNPADELDDLIFHISDWGGKSRFTKLQKSNGEKITFKKHYKTYISGLFIPEGAVWQVRYEPGVFSWDKLDVNMDLNDPSTDYESLVERWEGGESGDITLNDLPADWTGFVTRWEDGENDNLDLKQASTNYTFKLSDERQNQQTLKSGSLPVSVEIPVVSTFNVNDDALSQNWKIKSYKIGNNDPVTVNAASFTDKGGLTVEKDGDNLNITSLKRELKNQGGHNYWVNKSGRTDNLDWSPADWSDKGTIDLSKLDFRTESTSMPMTTANCYIIRHAGTYKLPLVYGNAVSGGDDNEQSYYPNVNGDITDGDTRTGGNNRLVKFVNHLGNEITSPYIENNDGCIPTGCAIIWQDEAEVVKNLSITGTTAASYDKSNVRYLQFTVDASTVCQNNALICIYQDLNSNGGYDDGEAVWSWLVWTTNDPALLTSAIPVTNYSGKVYNCFPLYGLGWIDPEKYLSREPVTVTLEQEESGNTIDIAIIQPDLFSSSYNSNYYQFGRKDPMCRKNTPAKGNFNRNGVGTVNLNTAIQNPGSFFSMGSGEGDWCSDTYNNLWTGRKSTTGVTDDDADIIKTVYDPSPVGYKVPASKAYSGFTSTGTNSKTSSEFNVYGTINEDTGFHFYTDNTKATTIFFPSTGYRAYHNGVVDGVGGVSYLWTASPATYKSGQNLYFYYTYVYPIDYNYRADGFSVRPVLE